jgi:hypothetical protein
MTQRGIQVRVFGPKSAAAIEAEGAGFVVPRETAKQLVDLFRDKLSQHRTGPVQMLVDAPDVPPTILNVSRYYGAAAVAHALRSPPADTGDTPALAGIFVLLPGTDDDADEAAVRAVQSSRDKNGKPLPLPPTVYDVLRDDARPLLAMLFFNPEAVTDATLRMLGVCLAEAFFTSLQSGNEKAPGNK